MQRIPIPVNAGRIMGAFCLVLALCGVAHAQQPQPAPPVYQVCWQPVYVPGDYVAVPRFVPLFDFCFGPRVVWQPRQQQPAPQPQPIPAPQQ